ncbi:MAG: hypothetical protein HOP14_07950 [Acidobacteria bacterium]|nr:hypothetical protein [Acidobacteriota bacterium]
MFDASRPFSARRADGGHLRSVLRASLLLVTVLSACAAPAVPEAGDAAAPDPASEAPAPAAPVTVGSALYTFTATTYPDLVPPPDRPRAGGSLTTFGDDFLLATAAGELYRLSWDGEGPLRSTLLPVRLPFDRQALVEAAGAGMAAPFRILDLLVDERGPTPRLYLAHHAWHPAERCISLRVSAWDWVDTPASGDLEGPWQTVFDTSPCLELERQWPRGEGADSSGGRLALHPDGLLLSVGDHGGDGSDGMEAFPQDTGNSYGKILLLSGTGESRVFSVGHRNPQGLTVDDQGRVWSSEHGPEGGDELNLVVRGGNYGWPLATYGTSYTGEPWPLAEDPRTHGRFREPALAFVPSVGTSQLLEIRGTALPEWTGDLLLASLRAELLFRIRRSGDRVVFAERINIGMRVRDMVEAPDGRLLLWNDAGQVVVLVRTPEA